MILLNQIDETKKNEVINLMRDKSLGIRMVPDSECQGLYYQTFRDLKRICKSKIMVFNLTNKKNNIYFFV